MLLHGGKGDLVPELVSKPGFERTLVPAGRGVAVGDGVEELGAEALLDAVGENEDAAVTVDEAIADEEAAVDDEESVDEVLDATLDVDEGDG